MSQRLCLLLSLLILPFLSGAQWTASLVHAATPGIVERDALPTYVEDASGARALTIDLRQKSATYGSFTLYIAGQGFYDGTAAVKPGPPGRVLVTYRGPARFFPAKGERAFIVTVVLSGQIDALRISSSLSRQGTIAVTVSGREYRIVTDQPTIADAIRTVSQVIAFVEKRNFRALYTLLSLEAQRAVSEADFIGSLQAQVKLGVGTTKQPIPTRITRIGTGRIVHQWGYDYFIQPVSVLLREPNGTGHIARTILYLAREGGMWRFMSTDRVR